jgi:hypothetical protein
MAIDPSAVVVGLLMALGNLGGVGILVKSYTKRIEDNEQTTKEHGLLMVRAIDNQQKTAETLERVQANILDLYGSRKEHDRFLTAIETLHDIKGCKTFYQKDRP